MTVKSVLMRLAFAAALLPQAAFAERGRDGQVNILYWQAPSIMNPYLSGGIKDIEPASIVLEPLARYDTVGEMVPWLAKEIPTLENGGVSEDLRQITWQLREGLLWSDATPVTSADVQFTWEYCTAEGGGCAQIESFDGIAAIDTPDAQTVVITFSEPQPFPYNAFVGAQAPVLQAAQFGDCLGPRAPQCTQANFNPIGTGPFTVTEFRPNDVIRFDANPLYREPDKPAFASVLLKGGTDAEAAARAVLETGQFDYAWNLQLSPVVLDRMTASGKGHVVSGFSTLMERIVFNLTDPSADLGPKRSTKAHPHPVLSDADLRRALSMAIDRDLLVEIGYGAAGRPTCNILSAPEIYASSANDACLVQDLDAARALLDAAGWEPGPDGVRVKDGLRLSLLFQTSTNAVRQDFQLLIKQWWEDIGAEVELRNIDPGVFFGSDPGNPDTYQKFHADVQMFANQFVGTDPEA
jgi:peptide/nickel transport system substrate-binding protein